MSTCSEVSLKHMKQKTSIMLKKYTTWSKSEALFSNSIHNILHICQRDYKYRSQMDPYHYELYIKSILNNKLLLLAVTEPIKWRLSLIWKALPHPSFHCGVLIPINNMRILWVPRASCGVLSSLSGRSSKSSLTSSARWSLRKIETFKEMVQHCTSETVFLKFKNPWYQ